MGIRFAIFRICLRAWSAAVGYALLDQLYRNTMQQNQIWEISELGEVLPLAASLVSYTAPSPW